MVKQFSGLFLVCRDGWIHLCACFVAGFSFTATVAIIRAVFCSFYKCHLNKNKKKVCPYVSYILILNGKKSLKMHTIRIRWYEDKNWSSQIEQNKKYCYSGQLQLFSFVPYYTNAQLYA